MSPSQVIAFLIVILLANASYENAKEAHRHTHLLLCQHGIEVEGADCHDTSTH